MSLKGQTIALTSDELVIDKSITITGPGSDQLAVSADMQYFRIFHVMAGPAVTIEGLTIGPSYAYYGCGILNDQATLTINNCAVGGIVGLESAAGIFNVGGTLTVVNSSITGNSLLYQGDGPGVLSSGTLIIDNSIISDNFAGKGYTHGGGIYSSGMLEITDSTVSGNVVSASGGGIYNTGVAIITSSTISFNFAGGGYPFPNGPGVGGGIANVGTLTITNSTVSGNNVLTTDKGPGCGGGVANSGQFHIAYTTISNNSATNGGGICNGATLEIGNTILDTGAEGPNIFNDGGTITSDGYNLSSDDGAGYLSGPGDQTNTHPILGPLQDNGGPTFTHALLPGSPAINAGDPNFVGPPDYDQRGPGFDRVRNARIDIGSFEAQPPRRATPAPRSRPTPLPRPTPR